MTIGELTKQENFPVFSKNQNNKEPPMGLKRKDDYLGISRLTNKNSKNAIIQNNSIDSSRIRTVSSEDIY